MTDDELLAAYGPVARRHAAAVARRIPGVLDRDDLEQEAYLALLTEGPPLVGHPDAEALIGWRIQRRLIDAVRRHAHTRATVAVVTTDDVPETPVDDDPFAAVDDADHVRAFLATLEPRRRHVARGRLAGRLLKDIGADLGVNESRTRRLLLEVEQAAATYRAATA